MVTLTKDVTLSPGESKVVPFEVIPEEAKVYSVNVDGLTGSFRAVSPEVPVTNLYGGVTDAETGVGIEGVEITLDGFVTHTVTGGVYAFEGVEIGSYTLTFLKAGYETITMEKVLLDMSETFPFYNWQNVQMVEAPLPPPPNDYILMGKDELYSYLINGSVATDWWGIPDSDRRPLARKIIEWWSYPIRAYVKDEGGSGCSAPPTYDPYKNPSESQRLCECYCEASLRYFRLGSKEGCLTNMYYWEQLEDRWKCFCPDYDFKLPIVIVGVSKGTFGHWVCGIQVGTNRGVFASWIFFNLDEIVTPGNPRQMPSGSSVALYDVTGVFRTGLVTLTTHPFVSFSV